MSCADSCGWSSTGTVQSHCGVSESCTVGNQMTLFCTFPLPRWDCCTGSWASPFLHHCPAFCCGTVSCDNMFNHHNKKPSCRQLDRWNTLTNWESSGLLGNLSGLNACFIIVVLKLLKAFINTMTKHWVEERMLDITCWKYWSEESGE